MRVAGSSAHVTHLVAQILNMFCLFCLLRSNIYAAALEWLIEHQSPADIALSSKYQSSVAMNVSSKFNNVVRSCTFLWIRKKVYFSYYHMLYQIPDLCEG